MNEDQLRSNFDALVTEVRRLCDGIAEHRRDIRFRDETHGIHKATMAQSPNERLWQLIDGAT